MTAIETDFLVGGRFVRVGRLHGDGFNHLDRPADVIAEARKRSRAIDVFTFAQTLPDVDRKFAYPMELDNSAALPVSTFDQWWTNQIDNKTRNMVRKSEKRGVVVKEVPFDSALVAGIHEIYNETPVRQGKRFWHYGKDMAAVERENSTFVDQSVFIGAFLERRLIGFVKMVIDRRGGQAGMMQILSMVSQRDVAPTNGLIAQAVRSCAARNVDFLCYARLHYGNKQHDSLVTFKLSNGFRRIDVPRYYVPLTLRGRLALRTGLHHSLADRVPDSVLAPLREIRRRWYVRSLARHGRVI